MTMRRILYIIIICTLSSQAYGQHVFKGTPLSKALAELDQSTKRYDISFICDELEDFTVTKTIKRGRSIPDAVCEVCGFYPVRVIVKGHDILVECIRKDRTKLTGRLVGPDRQPVAFANIFLSSPSDTTYIGGGVSNEAGDFVIPFGTERARVRISCVGFKTIERVMPISDAGTIRMQMEDYYLNNITVSGRMPIIRSEADRLQYIVSNDEFAHGLSAQELLSRVPMVTMMGGQAMILGKGPARFMLNGRITEMGDEAIQQKLWTMRSEDIDRIEVLSIPSGRDMMEMGGGYINIVMRRDQNLGWRGDISTEAGISDDWSGRANGSVSYASEKFDMTIDVHGGRTTQTTDNLMSYGKYDDGAFTSNTHAKQKDKEFAANQMLRYQPTKNLELGGMLSWQTLWPEKVTYGEEYISENVFTSEAHQDPKDNTTTKSLTAYCDWRIDSRGKQLSFTYNNYKKDDDGMSYVSADNYQTATFSRDFYYLVKWEGFESNVDYHIQSAKLDVALPFDFASINVGASYTNIRNQANIDSHLASTMSYMTYADRVLDYQEKTKAAYLSLRHDWGKFALNAGLRYEHIDWKEESVNSTSYMISGKNVESKDYWLPSLSLSFKPHEDHQINISWGTSALRPNFYDLNPFRIYKTAFEYSEGTPLLKPSRMSNIELSYFNRHGLYACAYHHHGSDMIIQETNISSLNGAYLNRNSQAVTTFYNYGRINQTGLYLRYHRQLSDHLMATAEGDVFYHDATSKGFIDQFNGWGKRLTASADWYLNRQHTLLLNFRYQHWFSDYRDLIEIDSYGYFYFALRCSMLDEHLKLSLVANDPFHQHVTDETIYNSKSGWYSYDNDRFTKQHLSHTNHHSHYVGLTATYSFGSKKVRHIRHDIENTESKRAEKL